MLVFFRLNCNNIFFYFILFIFFFKHTVNPSSGGVVCVVICLSRAASQNVLSSIGPMHLFSDSTSLNEGLNGIL